jgi:pyruvyltransferase
MVYEAVALGKQVIFPSWIIRERILKYVRSSAEYEIFRRKLGHHADSVEHMIDIIERQIDISPKSREFFEDYLPANTIGRSGKSIADKLLELSLNKERYGNATERSVDISSKHGKEMVSSSPGLPSTSEAGGESGRTGGGMIRTTLYYDLSPDLIVNEGSVPLTWWINQPNFGDLLSPWLVEKMTKMPVAFNDGSSKCYIAIGSVLKRVTRHSIVWGSGCFGTEAKRQVSRDADYRAVRGPLTRAKLVNVGIRCPEVYGDPALLVPFFYWPTVEITAEVGVILRWSERKWSTIPEGNGVKKIYLKSDNIESVLQDILRCRRVVSSSLHGLIIADAYGIPNAWLASSTPKGGEFKFFDYFLTVNKIRRARSYDFGKYGLDMASLLMRFDFDDRKIDFDYEALLRACPFIQVREAEVI